MGLQIVRFEKENVERWGVVKGDKILILQGSYHSLAAILRKWKRRSKKIS